MTVHFNYSLQQLHEMIGESSAKVEHAVLKAVNAVATNDPEAALAVIAGDREIDLAENHIEEECLKTLALYQPVAGDLRQVISILKINNELERAADLAVNIAERVPDIVRQPLDSIEKIDFSDMVRLACAMLKKALDSMTYLDVVAAAEVIKEDDAVDEIHKNNYSLVKDKILSYPSAAGYYLDCLTVSRCLERIGDIATNVAEDVIYLGSGKIVRHVHEGEP